MVPKTRNGESGVRVPDAVRAAGKRKLSFNEQREFERLPGLIADLEEEQESLNTKVAHPEFYKESADAIKRTLARLDQIQSELMQLYAAWDDLDSRSK